MSQISQQWQQPDTWRSILKEFHDRGLSKKECVSALRREFGQGRLIDQPEPHKATVYRELKELDADTAAPWKMDSRAPGVDTSIALDTIAEAVFQTDGRVNSVSVPEVRLVSEIRTSRPEMHLWLALRISKEYLRRRRNKESTIPLDLLLAIAPWRDRAALHRYLNLDPEVAGSDHPWLAWDLIGGAVAANRLRALDIDEETRAPFKDFTLQIGYWLSMFPEAVPDAERESALARYEALMNEELAGLQESLEGVFNDAKKG